MLLLRLPGVFAPHPETRLLAAAVREHLASHPGRVLDLCTGTGVLAIEAAQHGARAVTAVDIAHRAVLSARCNARVNRVRVEALCGDLFAPVGARRFDLVVSNPPYVPAASATVPQHGAARSYDAGLRGRVLLDRICEAVPRHLAPGGRLLLTQSSIAGAEESCRRLADAGLEAEVVARSREPFGPVMRARAQLFEERGLLAAGVREEELVVISARRPGRVVRTGAGATPAAAAA